MKLKTTLIRAFVFSVLVLLSGALVHAAGPYLTFNTFSGHAGTSITVSGGGFAPGENVQIYFLNSSTPNASTSADSKGNLVPIPVTVPNGQTNSSIKITATGMTSGQSAANFFFVQPFLPTLHLKTSANTPFASASLSGSGFAPNETVQINFAERMLTAQADTKGAFSLNTQIPNVQAKTYLITGIGQSSGSEADASLYIGAFYPSVTPSQFYLSPQSTLNFSGGGFAPNEQVSITAKNSTGQLGLITADAKGNFKNAGALKTDFSVAGQTLNFVFTGLSSNATAATSVQVGTLSPLLNAAPYFINPSYSVSMWGSGFGKNEPVTIFDSANPGTAVAQATTDKFGDFTGVNVKIPYADAGTTRTFHAVGTLSGADNKVQINVGQLYPQLLPSAYFVKSAQEMKVYGYGFAAGENVDLTVNGKLLMVIKADSKTNITSDPLIVPFTKTLSVVATGELSGATASFNLTPSKFAPFVTADKYYVTPGAPISFSGQDFAPNEAVDVLISTDERTQSFEELFTDENGALRDNSQAFPFDTSDQVQFTFHGQTSGAETSLKVSTAKFIPWIAADKYFAEPQAIVQVTGHGFAATEKVLVSAGPASIEAPTNTRGDTAPVNVTIPFGVGPEGLKILITGELSKAQASVLIGVESFLANISPSSYYLAAGQSLTVTGTGFGPNEPVQMAINGIDQGTVTADAKGHFVSPSLTIPQDAQNTAEIDFEGTLSKAKASAKVTIAQPVNTQPATH